MTKATRYLAASALLLLSLPAWTADNDDLWSFTVSVDMGGMSMPVAPFTSCIAKNGTFNPGDDPQSKQCQVSEYKISGNTVTWKMTCTGKDAMSGSGEMTRTPGAMKGTIKLLSGGMQMTQVLNGKVVGACNAAAAKKAGQ